MIDFTECQIDLLSNYGGSDQKRGVIYNGKRYMLKLSNRTNTGDRNSLRDSYSNNVLSEYVCCHIITMCGYDAQNTLLGQITMDTKRHSDKCVSVVACENFIPDGYELIDFKNIQNALAVDKPGKIPKLHEIYDIYTVENVYFSQEFGQRALERYWDTFIFDALFGNFDRHGNNWGYLINKNTKEIKFAPIYDCGSCLYPQLRDDALDEILENEIEVKNRIYKFSQAALELKHGKKVNYYEFITSLCNNDCTAALCRVFPRLDLNSICSFIDSIDEISCIRKKFYKTMLEARYDAILLPAYKKLLHAAVQK